MKKIFVLLIVCTLCLVCGCQNKYSKLNGEYHNVAYEYSDVGGDWSYIKYYPTDVTLKISGNGKNKKIIFNFGKDFFDEETRDVDYTGIYVANYSVNGNIEWDDINPLDHLFGEYNLASYKATITWNYDEDDVNVENGDVEVSLWGFWNEGDEGANGEEGFRFIYTFEKD
jgi:hypothetical protein